MYESPITLMVQDIAGQMVQQTEQTILEVVRKCGVYVDKDELIKAINYDRDQYSKGYKDGVNDALNKIKTEIDQLPSYVARFNGGAFAIHIDKEGVLQILDKDISRKESK